VEDSVTHSVEMVGVATRPIKISSLLPANNLLLEEMCAVRSCAVCSSSIISDIDGVGDDQHHRDEADDADAGGGRCSIQTEAPSCSGCHDEEFKVLYKLTGYQPHGLDQIITSK
jgi:5-methylcytosine-specific restriction endonuclease McrA